MTTLDRDYIFFVAHYEHKGRHYTFILNNDFTVETFLVRNSYYGDYDLKMTQDNIRPENLFDVYDVEKENILEKANSRNFYKVDLYEGKEFDIHGYHDVTKTSTIKLTFKPHRVNVKMSYFEEECLE